MRGLLTAAQETDDADSEYLFQASFLMANIAPRAAEDSASPEELLLAALLGVYQTDHNLFRGMRSFSARAHVRRAFEYAQELGDPAVARKLIHDVIRRMDPGPPKFEELRRQDRLADPAIEASHERDMADLAQRELKAAMLFDPTADFDMELLNRDQEG